MLVLLHSEDSFTHFLLVREMADKLFTVSILRMSIIGQQEGGSAVSLDYKAGCQIRDLIFVKENDH